MALNTRTVTSETKMMDIDKCISLLRENNVDKRIVAGFLSVSCELVNAGLPSPALSFEDGELQITYDNGKHLFQISLSQLDTMMIFFFVRDKGKNLSAYDELLSISDFKVSAYPELKKFC